MRERVELRKRELRAAARILGCNPKQLFFLAAARYIREIYEWYFHKPLIGRLTNVNQEGLIIAVWRKYSSDSRCLLPEAVFDVCLDVTLHKKRPNYLKRFQEQLNRDAEASQAHEKVPPARKRKVKIRGGSRRNR